MKRTNYFSLVTYMFSSELRSDLNRYYLGTIWWFLEPCLYVAVFYIVFANFRGGDGEFLYNLMCGLVTWKWISSIINQGASSLVRAKGLVTNFNVHPLVFPTVSLMVNTFKFFAVLAALLVLLAVKGALAFSGAEQLLLWFVVTSTVIFSYQILLSTMMPFLPDLRVIVTNMMMLLMFTSGVIIPVEQMPESVQGILYWNPFVYLIEGARAIFLHNDLLDYPVFGYLFLVHALLLVLGVIRLTSLKGEFPKRII